MSELKNVNDSHHDNDNDENIPMTYDKDHKYDEDIPMTWHIFEVKVTETAVYHQGAHIPSQIKGKEAIEAYMEEARKASRAGEDGWCNPHNALYENIYDDFTYPVKRLDCSSTLEFLHTFDPDAPNPRKGRIC